MTAPAVLAPPRPGSLAVTAQALVAGDKGLLAIDESVPTCNRRFARLGIIQDEPTRRAYHTLTRCGDATEEVLSEVFGALRNHGVALEGMLLKPNMILAGASCPDQESVRTVADATIACLRHVVPAAVAGIAFLSGGQSGDLASARLNALCSPDRPALPWPVTFSFGRAIQQPALTIWAGQAANVSPAQQSLLARATANHDARRGNYTPSPPSPPRPRAVRDLHEH